jgi:hypothetical protein
MEIDCLNIISFSVVYVVHCLNLVIRYLCYSEPHCFQFQLKNDSKVKVKLSHYRPGQALGAPGG